MNDPLVSRHDLMSIFNHAHFRLRHYACGFYPTRKLQPVFMPVNRMFFPLENPNGKENFIQDANRTVEFCPGKMYFIPAYYPVRMVLDRELRFLSLQSSLEIFPGVELFSGCRRFLELTAPPEKNTLLEICMGTASSPEICFQAVEAGAAVLKILADLLSQFPAEEFWPALALRQYAGLMDFLEKQGDARTSVSDLAAFEKESREGFTRHFIRCTGMTPKQLIDRFVISRCLTLIDEGKRFKEIARQLHFSNEFVFSRYFKRNTGFSPRVYRAG